MKALILVGAFQGLRCAEMVGLERTDVMDDADPPKLRVMHGKGGHERMLPLHPVVLEALRKMPMPPGAVCSTPCSADRSAHRC